MALDKFLCRWKRERERVCVTSVSQNVSPGARADFRNGAFFFAATRYRWTIETGLGGRRGLCRRRIVDPTGGISAALIVISLFGMGRGKTMSGWSNAARAGQTAEWAINDRMPHADEPLFSSNRHCNMKHRQLPDKIIIRLITCQLQTLVVCLLIYSPPRRSQFHSDAATAGAAGRVSSFASRNGRARPRRAGIIIRRK